MKKIFLVAVSVLFTSIAFSQIKHNKFSTVIDFDKYSIDAYGLTVVSEMPNNGGYFLSNEVPSFMNFRPGLFRLDYQGNVLLDTVYTFTTMAMSTASTFVINSIAKSGTNTVLYSTSHTDATGNDYSSPYLIKTDTNGTILWHYGYGGDTTGLAAKQLIATQDGGYLMIGERMDYGQLNTPLFGMGFAIKVDASGQLEWNKLYGNSDTMTMLFNDGIQLDNGDFLFAGKVGGEQSFSTTNPWSTGIVRTDNNGDVIWSQGMVLSSPISISPDYMNTTSCGMFDDNNAFVSYAVEDTSTSKTGFAVTSINVNTGVTNWNNVYFLPASNNLEVKKAIADGKGNVVVTAQDYNTGVLFMLDGAGDVVQNRRFTSTNNTAFPYHTIATESGGFMHVNEVDYEKVLVVKTDGDLDPSCANIDSAFLMLTSTPNNTTTFSGVIDTVISLTTINTMQLTYGTAQPIESESNLICACSNSISGVVYHGSTGFAAEFPSVVLIRKGVVPSPWAIYDTVLAGSSGSYSFIDIPTDSFIICVIPEPSLYPTAITSYFNYPTSSYKWDSAGVFHVHCDSAVIIKDVTLFDPGALTGNSSLNGYVYENIGGFNKLPGDPIPGIEIVVEQSPGGVVGGATTNAGGYFELVGLDTNNTYVVSIDFPGMPNDSVYTMLINLNDTIFDSLNFYIDTTGIYIQGSGSSIGIDFINTDNIDVDLYPNPSTGVFNVKINAIKPDEITYQLTNEFGQLIIDNKRIIHLGENNIVLQTDELSKGVYFLKIRQKNNVFIKKLIKL